MIHKVILLLFTVLLYQGAAAQDCQCEELNGRDKGNTATLLTSASTFCRAKGYEQAAADFLQKKEFDSAEIYLKQAELLYQRAGCKDEKWFTLYKEKSSLHLFKAEYQPALDFSLKVLAIAKKYNDHQQEADILLNISIFLGVWVSRTKGLPIAVLRCLPLQK